MRVVRVDRASAFRGVEATPQGGLRVAAALTRTGVFTYRLADGTEVREYRAPEEVFKADSLATLRGAPLTDDHPAQPVTTGNYRALAVGHVADDVQPEGRLVVAHLLVQDAAEVSRVQSGDRVELSCGYECRVVDAPGVSPEGERYDRVQTDIVYNHVALGPAGWGRAGPSVALRMDGAGVELAAGEPALERPMKTITFRGKTYKVDSPEDMAAMQAAADAAPPAAASADAPAQGDLIALLKQVMMVVAGLQSNLAAAEAKLVGSPATGALEPDGDEAELAMDSKVAARLAFEDDAKLVLGADASLRGKSRSAIRREVVAKTLPKAATLKLDSLAAPVLEGMYLGAIEGARAAVQARADAAEKQKALDLAAGGVGLDRKDAATDDAAQTKRDTATQSRWQQPTTLTRQNGAR